MAKIKRSEKSNLGKKGFVFAATIRKQDVHKLLLNSLSPLSSCPAENGRVSQDPPLQACAEALLPGDSGFCQAVAGWLYPAG